MTPSYHHGALPDALRAATVQLVHEKGPLGFSLREVARRAGVSHAAPKHHFGDAQGLLTSVAIEGFNRLGDAFLEATKIGDTAEQRLREIGRAYVQTALDSPGHFRVMMQQELLDSDDQELLESSLRTHSFLVETIDQLAREVNPELDIDTAVTLCWASMHGLVELTPKLKHMADRHGAVDNPLNETIDRFHDLLILGLQART